MAFPLLPAAAGIYGISKLFRKRPEYKIPEFFGQNYQHMVGALKQAGEAQYGTGLTDIREALANTGLGNNAAAMTDINTRFSIAKGQDILGIESSAYANEYQQQRAAEMEKNRLDYEAATAARGQELSFAGDLAGTLGSLYAGKGKKSSEDESVPLNDMDYFEQQRNKPGQARKILKFLLGF
jgi:hypothetical protein